jgi:hypothetical protein
MSPGEEAIVAAAKARYNRYRATLTTERPDWEDLTAETRRRLIADEMEPPPDTSWVTMEDARGRRTDLKGDPVSAHLSKSAAQLIREIREERENKLRDQSRVGLVQLSHQMLSRLLDLAEGYEVLTVYANSDTRSIHVLVRSQELDPVVPGSVPPTLGGQWNGEQLFHDGKTWIRWGWMP